MVLIKLFHRPSPLTACAQPGMPAQRCLLSLSGSTYTPASGVWGLLDSPRAGRGPPQLRRPQPLSLRKRRLQPMLSSREAAPTAAARRPGGPQQQPAVFCGAPQLCMQRRKPQRTSKDCPVHTEGGAHAEESAGVGAAASAGPSHTHRDTRHSAAAAGRRLSALCCCSKDTDAAVAAAAECGSCFSSSC